MGIETIYNNYSHVGDNMTIILSLTMIFLRHLTYSRKEIKLKVFSRAINSLIIATGFRLIQMMILQYYDYSILTLSLNNLYYLFLTFVFMNYNRYIIEIFGMKENSRKKLEIFCVMIGSILSIFNIVLPFILNILKINYSIQELELLSFNSFKITYAYHILLILIILIRYKKIIMKKVWISFIIIATISVLVVTISWCRNDISFLTFTFLLPLVAAYNLLHNKPYDIELGTLDATAFENYLKELHSEKNEFTLICLYLDDINNQNYIKEIRNDIFTTYEYIFRKSYLFKLNDKKFVLVIKHKDYNTNIFDEYIPKLKETLDYLLYKYKSNYKVTFIESNEMLEKNKQYMTFNKYLENKNADNTITFCTKEDIELFFNTNYIISELYDIVKNNNLNDERVLVYCQPVFNINKQRYDSAEALMRLNLKNIGIVYPDIFIPLAEQENCIHTLSMIILNKTCQKIKEIEQQGLELSRISVNFSIMELRQKGFCDNVVDIILKNNIPFEKIAIELTESKNEQDFVLIKEKVEKLKKLGMYFYLDDFGTGYSNFDRIMQLPIDIIKFDRSLVLMSNKNINYQYMIKNFSTTFEQLGYKILFEGIENQQDEDMCINMNANYLQGYKYSKPIPVDKLDNFLSKI